jgi:hypothetical protein
MSGTFSRKGYERRRIVAAAAAFLFLHLLLALPARPGELGAAAWLRLPLELALVVALLLAFPARAMRAALGLLILAALVLKLADLATEVAFRRPFNPVLDAGLVPAAWRLASGAVGWPTALAVLLAAVLAFLLVVRATWWATGEIARLAPAGRGARGLALAAAALLVVAPLPGEPRTARLAWDHLRDARQARADLASFRREAAADARAALPPGEVLAALQGTDVLLVFVESYGRSALENPLYRPTVTAALSAAGAPLQAAGLAARSGFLASPVVGGQSWLAHATLLSGLGVQDQGRYRALLASPRKTLLHLAQAAGWETAAVMPAITLAWPEAAWFGYDRVLAAADLGYAGPPFNWVTMPDQFTLAALERTLLDPALRPPVFAEVALISSHAPWTPIPPLLPWDALGDGRVFDPYAAAGDPPDVVWRDPDRVRAQYLMSLDYVLRSLGEFALRRAARPTLLVVVGDHQPAAFVSGDETGRDVPVHVIGPPALLARLDAWGWTPGLLPGRDAPVWPMQDFRDRFLSAFAGEPPARAAANRQGQPLPGASER